MSNWNLIHHANEQEKLQNGNIKLPWVANAADHHSSIHPFACLFESIWRESWAILYEWAKLYPFLLNKYKNNNSFIEFDQYLSFHIFYFTDER